MTTKSGRFTYQQRNNGRGVKKPLGEYNRRKPHRQTAFICKVSKNVGTQSYSLPLAASPRPPKMNECLDVEEMVRVAFDNFLKDADKLRDIAAFWSHSSKLIDSPDHDGTVEEKAQTLTKLLAIRDHTVKYIENFDAADFSKSFIALAKIFFTLTSKRNDARERDDMDLFRCILVENGDPSENPFQFFVYAAIPLLPQLTPRDLACGSYALSLLSWSDTLKDGMTLLDGISSEVVSRGVNEFDSRALSRILFDVAKSGQSQPQFFSVVGTYLCGLDATRFAPGEMANILFAFSSAGETNHDIFHNIANAIVALYTSSTRLAWFKPADLSTIMWSFTHAGELQTDQFQRTLHKALFAKLCRMHEAFRLDDLSSIVYALSQSSSNPSILTKMATRINFDALSLDYEAASLVSFLWTCCQQNVHIEELFCEDSNFMTACLKKKDEYEDDELRKLYNFHLWQQELCCDGLPSELHDKCFEAHLLPSNLLSGYD